MGGQESKVMDERMVKEGQQRIRLIPLNWKVTSEGRRRKLERQWK